MADWGLNYFHHWPTLLPKPQRSQRKSNEGDHVINYVHIEPMCYILETNHKILKKKKKSVQRATLCALNRTNSNSLDILP